MVLPIVITSCSIGVPVCASVATGVMGGFVSFGATALAFLKKNQIALFFKKRKFIVIIIVSVVILWLLWNYSKDEEDKNIE